MNTNDYSGVRLLLGAYLHQDFLDEFASAMNAVQAFAAAEPLQVVQTAISDIDSLLSDEWFLRSPDAILSDLGSCYDPRSEGVSVTEWLRQVRGALQAKAH